ncbi:MAG: hypothetical protein ACUVWB_08515 [Anaerolineae bacterium]
MLQVFGSASMAELFGDFIVYRRLEPPDPRLPGLEQLWKELGWLAYRIPRKAEPEYAQVVARILEAARRLDAPHARLERLIFLGDTYMNDGSAFANLCTAGGWEGLAFIGADKPAEAPRTRVEGRVFLANRWAGLAEFLEYARRRRFAFDERLAVVIDMDKTLVGARGRNDKVIDIVRVQAVKDTVASALGEQFDHHAFQHAYDTLNQQTYHPFTQDNQDLLAYLCLIIGAGLYSLEEVLDGYRAGHIPSFDAFIHLVDRRREELRAAGLLDLHQEVLTAWDAGDPTPFKAFRYREYELTAARYDPSPADDIPIEGLLQERILITQEVRQVAQYLRRQGVLIFGLSDKPDEASIPQPAMAARGWKVLHHCPTLCVGEPLAI